MITISKKALAHVIKLMEDSNISFSTHALRVGVKGGGCSGLSYVCLLYTSDAADD